MPYYEPSFGDEYNPDQMPVDYPGFDVPLRARRMTPDQPIDSTIDSALPPAIDRPHPSKWGSIAGAFKKYAPDLIGGALAAGSQPNIAGGGPTDVIRAAAAGYAVPQMRAARQQAEARQRRADEIAARRAEADIAQSQAQMEANKAHEALYQKQLNVPGFKEKYGQAIENGATPQEALIIASGGTLQDKRLKSKTDDYTEVDAETGRDVYGVMPDAEGRYWVHTTRLQQKASSKKAETPAKPTFTEAETEKITFRKKIAPELGYKEGTAEYNQFVYGTTGKVQPPQKPPAPRHPAAGANKPVIKDHTDQNGNVTRVIQYPDGRIVTKDLGPIAAPKTPGKGNPKNELLDALRKQFPANF